MDKGGYSALMLAASNNHVQSIVYLEAKGADLNLQDDSMGWTALIWAVKQGHQDAMTALFALEADASLTDHEGKTVYDWIRAGSLEPE
ncbi:Ankyrin repeat protein [Candidatus Venteria ishoeyi]|uniref:Ankyrin repeat protein n=1 Tax=Candidatus Venteria ishoeyi TaxID=1899563 RepID=A0A1H6F6N7_9GAMM|nr:Ankyrin repeat protein [Candidatus Venteria ishoeyi]